MCELWFNEEMNESNLCSNKYYLSGGENRA